MPGTFTVTLTAKKDGVTYSGTTTIILLPDPAIEQQINILVGNYLCTKYYYTCCGPFSSGDTTYNYLAQVEREGYSAIKVGYYTYYYQRMNGDTVFFRFVEPSTGYNGKVNINKTTFALNLELIESPTVVPYTTELHGFKQ